MERQWICRRNLLKRENNVCRNRHHAFDINYDKSKTAKKEVVCSLVFIKLVLDTVSLQYRRFWDTPGELVLFCIYS